MELNTLTEIYKAISDLPIVLVALIYGSIILRRFEEKKKAAIKNPIKLKLVCLILFICLGLIFQGFKNFIPHGVVWGHVMFLIASLFIFNISVETD